MTTETSETEIVFDCETNGLNPTRIWCVVAQVLGGEEYSFTDAQTFNKFVAEHRGATWYAHNGICFDYPVLERLWGTVFEPAKRRDTMVLSRLASPSRVGGHALKSWGAILGYPKGDHSDWSRYSPAMLEYCKRDVRVTVGVLRAVRKELEGFDERSIRLEHEVAEHIFTQEENGWLLDAERAFDLAALLKEKKYELEDEVRRKFKPLATSKGEVAVKWKKNGALSKVGLQWLGVDALEVVGGDFTRVHFPDFNLGSRQQIGRYLQWFGWKPARFTETGQAEVSEKVLLNIKGIPEAELIADYLTVEKRIAMVQSWLEFQQEDGRVHGRVNSNGAVTGRMTHYEPNMAQVTSGSKIYGREMRQCFIAEAGRSIVGMDASGLELRMLAHYMQDDDYIREVADGDVHTANQKAAGLPTRDTAKTFIYAFLYGAGDEKIGAIAGGGKSKGRKLKAQFLDNTPALKRLRKRVQEAARRGWLRGLDGRRIAVRSSHAALNTLLQGAGAVVMKQALCNLVRLADANQLDYKLVGNIHDEIQSDVRNDHAETFGKLSVQALVQAGKDFNLRCPLAAEYKIGKDWSETH